MVRTRSAIGVASALHGLQAAVRVELAKDVLEVIAHRADRNHQIGGDLRGRSPGSEVAQHLLLALRERLDVTLSGGVPQIPVGRAQAYAQHAAQEAMLHR
jgi:hypothetical protein